MIRRNVAGCALTIAAMAMGSLVHAQEAPAGDSRRGAEAFKTVGCWECHGSTGAGGGWQGPKIAPGPIGWGAFAYQVRKPRAKMPPYRPAVLSDTELADIYAYLRSIPPERSADQIGLLQR